MLQLDGHVIGDSTTGSLYRIMMQVQHLCLIDIILVLGRVAMTSILHKLYWKENKYQHK